MRLDQREIARYLGAAGKPLWPEAAAWARDCQRELEGTVTPRLLGRRLSLSLFAGDPPSVRGMGTGAWRRRTGFWTCSRPPSGSG